MYWKDIPLRFHLIFSDAFAMSFCIYEPILAFDSSTVKEISIFFQKILKIIDIRE